MEIKVIKNNVSLAFTHKFTTNGDLVLELPSEDISDEDFKKKFIKFFVPTFPCWFGRCQELRDAYKKEEENMSCTSCKGRLINKYMMTLKELYLRGEAPMPK